MSSLSLASCPPDKLDLILQCSSQSLFLQETSPEPSQDELSAPSVAIASTNCWLPRLCSFSTVTSLEIETSPYSSLHSSILGPDTKQLFNKCYLKFWIKNSLLKEDELKLKEDIYHLHVMKNFLFYKNVFFNVLPQSHIIYKNLLKMN